MNPTLNTRATHLPVNECFGPTVQGEGPYAGRAASFVRLGGCNLQCTWCVVPGMAILRPDFTYTPVEDLRVGDTVLGMTVPGQGRHGQLGESTVTNTFRRKSPLVRVNGNLTCAAETEFWAAHNYNMRSGWREAGRCEGLSCTFLAEPMKRDHRAYELGYLAGAADSAGCFWNVSQGERGHHRFRLDMDEQNVLDQVLGFAANHGFTLRPGQRRCSEHVVGGDTESCLWLTDSVEAERFADALSDTPDSESWRWGYLAGVFDAAGSLSEGNTLRITRYHHVHDPAYARIADTARRLNFHVDEHRKGLRLSASNGDLWRFLIGATPVTRSALDRAIGAPDHARTIRAVEPAGDGDVVSLTTSTGNYIAEGWLVHNCDTPWTWDQDRYDLLDENPERRVSDVCDEIATIDAPITVLTGGEPLLHQARDAFAELLIGLSEFSDIHVETNGTIAPTELTRQRVAHFSVSPKLTNNGADPRNKRIKSNALRAFDELAFAGRAIFKFVVSDTTDLEEVEHVVAEYQLPSSAVWIMAEGSTAQQLLATQTEGLVREVLERGWNFTTRLQVLVWGDRRGV